MGRKWLNSVDLETDANDRPIIEGQIAPTKCAALGGKTTADGWDSGNEYDLTAGGTIIPAFVHVFVKSNHAYLLADNSANDPAATAPAAYAKDQTHIIPVRGQTKLHFKSETAGSAATLTVTVFGT